MQITEEQIRRLMHYARVSREEARQALEQADGDLLNALELLLDKKQQEEAQKRCPAPPERPKDGSLTGILSRILRFLVENRLEACLPGTERRIECPIVALIALLFLAWYALLFFVALGVCLGWRFHFVGPDLGKESVNRVVSDLDDAAESLRDAVAEDLRAFARERRRSREEKKHPHGDKGEQEREGAKDGGTDFNC